MSEEIKRFASDRIGSFVRKETLHASSKILYADILDLASIHASFVGKLPESKSSEQPQSNCQ